MTFVFFFVAYHKDSGGNGIEIFDVSKSTNFNFIVQRRISLTAR